LAIVSARKQERVCLRAHIEQYFESIVSIEGEERGRFRVKGKVGWTGGGGGSGGARGGRGRDSGIGGIGGCIKDSGRVLDYT